MTDPHGIAGVIAKSCPDCSDIDADTIFGSRVGGPRVSFKPKKYQEVRAVGSFDFIFWVEIQGFGTEPTNSETFFFYFFQRAQQQPRYGPVNVKKPPGLIPPGSLGFKAGVWAHESARFLGFSKFEVPSQLLLLSLVFGVSLILRKCTKPWQTIGALKKRYPWKRWKRWKTDRGLSN